jgi:hypothetical protein
MSISRKLFEETPKAKSRTIDILNADIHSSLSKREIDFFQRTKAISLRPENYTYSQTLEEVIELDLRSTTRLKLLQLIKSVYSELHRIDAINNRTDDSHAAEFFTRAIKLYPTFPDLKFSHACTLLSLSHHGHKKERRVDAFKLMYGALTDKILLNASKNKESLSCVNTCKIHFEQRLLQVVKQESIQALVKRMLQRIWQEITSVQNTQTPRQQWQHSQHIFSNNTAAWYNPDVSIQNHQQQKLFALFDAAFKTMDLYLKAKEIPTKKLLTWIEQFSTAQVMALGFEMHPWAIIYGNNVASIRKSLPQEDLHQNKIISKANVRDICQNNYLRAYNMIAESYKANPNQPFEQHIVETFFSSLDQPLQQQALEAWLNFHLAPIAYHPPPRDVTETYLKQRKNAIKILDRYYAKRCGDIITDNRELCDLVAVSPFSDEEIAEDRMQALRNASRLPEMQLVQTHLRYLLLVKAIITRDPSAMAMLKSIFIEYFSWQQSRDESHLINWQHYGFVLQSAENETSFAEMIAFLIPHLSNDTGNYVENSQYIMAKLFSYGSRFEFNDVALASFAQKCMDLAEPRCRGARREYSNQVRNTLSPESTDLTYFRDLYYKAKGLNSPKKTSRENTISKALIDKILDHLLNPATTQAPQSSIPHTHHDGYKIKLAPSQRPEPVDLANRLLNAKPGETPSPPSNRTSSSSRQSATSLEDVSRQSSSSLWSPRKINPLAFSYASPERTHSSTPRKVLTVDRSYFNEKKQNRRAISPINSAEKTRKSQTEAKTNIRAFPGYK